jgi:hypothetical protein
MVRALALAAVGLAGCAGRASNPSFPTKLETARDDLKRMESSPRPLDRPLVIVGGFLDPGIAGLWLKGEFSSLSGDERIIWVELFSCASLQECRERIVRAVDKAFPDASSDVTREVDVVGVSLGGLAARYASGPTGRGRRLKIARLFTISSPLRGSKEAQDLPLLVPIQAQLRPGSMELALLNASDAGYPIYPYVCLGDQVIGEKNAAPPGKTPWWVSPAPLADVHGGAFYDARFLADIARRLRHEPALSREPAAVLPTEP